MKLLGISILLFLFWSCQDNNSELEAIDASDTLASINLHLDHMVDGQGLVFNDIRYQNAAGNQYSVMTLKYYISDLVLNSFDGKQVKIDTFHYRDIEFPETGIMKVEGIPPGEYTSIGFIFGLDSVKNETGALPPTQANNNMEWPIPMGGGYHYMKFEGRYLDQDSKVQSFNTHMGRLQTMPPESKLYENFFYVQLPNSTVSIEPDDQWEIQVLMNLNQWYQDPVIYDINQFGPAIMGNQDAQKILQENGKNAFSLGYIFKNKTVAE